MYETEYKSKLTTPERAAQRVSNASVLAHGMTVGEPPALLGAIANRVRSGDLKQLKVFSMLPLENAATTILAEDISDRLEAFCWFVSPSDRELVKAGIDCFVPNEFHQIPKIIQELMKIDVVVATVSPMDSAGFFTFGTNNDYITTAARHCGTLMVEVNPNMPRVFGDSLLHVSEVDAVVEYETPLVEAMPAKPKPEADSIGKALAELVPDGATLQLGVGSIPDAVAKYLENHRDLGIHTELFGPGMANLIKKGAATGKKKSLHPRKHVYTNAMGNKEMYDFMNDNPSMESYPVSYVNDPNVIARNDNMISINSTIEVDLLGQCNSEFLDGVEFSGTGGQLDYVRGAFKSKGGKAFIAFYSTARGGQISRVVPRLPMGAVVTTPRMDTHYLATEYGVVNLMGKSTRDRALDIIGLAHPKFRDDLLSEAKKMKLIR